MNMLRLYGEDPLAEFEATQSALRTRLAEYEKEKEKCEEEYEKIRQNKRNSTFQLEEQEEMVLAELPKQNAFQRMLGALVTRFSGKKKFGELLIGLETKVDKLANQEVKQARRESIARREAFKTKLIELETQIEERINEKLGKLLKSISTLMLLN